MAQFLTLQGATMKITASLPPIAPRSALKYVTGLGTALLFAAALSVPVTAMAAPTNCGPRNELLKALAKKYSEAPTAVGLSNSGALVEVLTSDRGATWTILVSKPDGTSCLVAAGEEWQALKHVASGDLGT
jgi:hypothetical protein